MNTVVEYPSCETRYNFAVAWLIPFGVIFFSGLSIVGIFYFVDAMKDGNWKGGGWLVISTLFGWLAISGIRLIPFIFVTLKLDSTGLRIITKKSEEHYPWSKISGVCYHENLKVLDVYSGKRILSVDYFLSNFENFSSVLDFYTDRDEGVENTITDS